MTSISPKTPPTQLSGTIACANTLGECAVWDHRQGALLWVDIEQACLFRSRPPFTSFERFQCPERIGSFALVPGDETIVIAAFESGFARFTYTTGAMDWITRPELPPTVRFNDGRVDRTGHFWAGTMGETPENQAQNVGKLFRLNRDGSPEIQLDNIKIPNSLCWSPDGTTMYFADSPHNTIWAFDYRDGAPANRRIFAQTPSSIHPDGSTIDADGYLWNAQWGASRVVRYAPNGSIDFVLPIPAPHVTCPSFGGPNMSQLFVTSARADMDDADLAAAPDAGSVFIFDTQFRGLAENLCQDPNL